MSDDSWFFIPIASSEYCPPQDASVRVLRYERTLSEVLELREWIEMRSAVEIASHKDHEEEMKRLKNK